MDFIFSRDPSHVDQLKILLRPLADKYPAKSVFAFTGDWGCLVSTGSHYKAFDPGMFYDHVIIVSGDPLIASDDPNRTASIGRCLKNTEPLRPQHPASILSVNTLSGTMKVTTDAWGAVPVYMVADWPDILVGSSPDLLALAHPCSIDALSACEKLCANQISYPNTLYQQIKEMPPGTDTKFKLANAEPIENRWWHAPLPSTDIPRDDWYQTLNADIADTLNQLYNQVGPKGSITLSSGLDSRYLLDMACKNTGFDLAAVNIAACKNISSRTASQVAARYQVPFSMVARRTDHYAAVALSDPPEIGSNTCLTDAHFADRALDDLPNDEFLIGGYMADTIIIGGDPFTKGRERAIARKEIPQDAPRWAANALYLRFDAETRAQITARWDAADYLLGLTPAHSRMMSRIYPANRQGHKGHFDTARRNYPIYEPFMTPSALSLGFRLPDDIKSTQGLKSSFYGQHLALTSDIPVNVAASRAYRQMIRLVKAVMPKRLLPLSLTHSGEWQAVSGPLAPQHRQAILRSSAILEKELGIILAGCRGERHGTTVMQIAAALARCETT